MRGKRIILYVFIMVIMKDKLLLENKFGYCCVVLGYLKIDNLRKICYNYLD